MLAIIQSISNLQSLKFNNFESKKIYENFIGDSIMKILNF